MPDPPIQPSSHRHSILWHLTKSNKPSGTIGGSDEFRLDWLADCGLRVQRLAGIYPLAVRWPLKPLCLL